jgi:mannosyltransferase
VMAVVVALCVTSAVFNVIEDRTQAGSIASAIAAEARPGDVVVLCPDQLGPAVDRELPDDVVGVVYPTLAGPERVDWADYEARHDQADPADFADAVVDRAAPSGSVWLVTSFGYRTLEGDCERVVSELGSRRPSRALVVAEDPEVFEHAALYVFRG